MLHTVNKSPFEKNSLETCLRLAEDNSSILLIEDGVYGALQIHPLRVQLQMLKKLLNFMYLGQI